MTVARMQAFRNWLQSLNLQRKIILALVLGSLVIGVMVAVPAFILARSQMMENTLALLEARAGQERQEIQLRLAADVAAAESLAANTVTANALADTVGRDIYLVPLLRNQKLQTIDARLALTDYTGRVVASSGPHSLPGFQNDPGFARMMQTARPVSYLSQSPTMTANAGATLVVILPVIYRLTGNVEGAMVLAVPLGSLLKVRQGSDLTYLAGRGGSLLAGHVPAGPVLHVSHPLILPAPLGDLGLVHHHARDRQAALHDLDVMAMVFAAVGMLLVGIVVAVSRVAGRRLTTPLRELAAASEKVASTGWPQALAVRAGGDELGRLTQSFNQMVERLQRLHGELEQRVADRTQALASSEARLQYVMDATGEGVWDWNLVSNAVTHNAQWCTLLGLDENYLNHPLEAFVDLLHPDDRSEVLAAVQAALDVGAPYNHEHRMVRRDGRTIWVLDRGKVVERDGQGKPVRMVGSMMDITERKQATELVRVRELYLRATLDNLPFLFWLKDADSRFLTVNNQFAQACGRADPGEVVGLTDLDVWPRDLAEQYQSDDRAVMAQRREKALEEPVETAGERRWIETYKKPVISDDGSILGTVGFARDITARKETERALELSEQRWQVAVTGSNDGIWDWDLPSGTVYFSDRWKAMLGYAPDELEGRYEEWAGMLNPDDMARIAPDIQRHLAGETDYFQVEFRMRCKDGSEKWILSRGRALFDDAGKPIRMAGSHTDMTEMRAADLALRERTEQLNAIFDLSPDGFVSFDRDRRIKFVNAAFLRMAGLQDAELVGLDEASLSELLAEHCNPAMSFPGLEALRSDLGQRAQGKAPRRLIELTTPIRRILEVGLRLSESDMVPQILFVRDVTHETEVDQMKSEFLSTAAHELRTPMASILGFSELLLKQGFDEATRKELLQTIFKQSELMASILNELLDLARIEARRGKDFHLEPLSLAEMVRESVAAYSVPSGRQAPVLEFAEGWTPLVKADRKKTIQVVTNVLSNAYKYSPGGGEVRLSGLPIEERDGCPMAGFSIRDQGIGMSPDHLARLFERFFRADTSGKIPGTGLGMSIVKEIVELHRGHVEVASQLGQGTRVDIWLPVALEHDEPSIFGAPA